MWAVLSNSRVFNFSPRVIQTMSAARERVVEFFKAVNEGNVEMVDEMLKTNQIAVEETNTNELNATALDRAAYWGHEKIVHLLVNTYKANLNAINDYGKTPLQTAVDNYHAKIARFLIKNKSARVEYAYKILNTDEKVEELVEAAEENDIAKVSEILESKAVDVNVTDRSNYNGTLMHIAAKNGYEELARLLVNKYNADINITDDIGDRPVDTAVMNLNSSVADFLIEKESADKS